MLIVALHTQHVAIWCQNWLRTYTRENHAKNGVAADDGTLAERIGGRKRSYREKG
jgi:hypothetical protein